MGKIFVLLLVICFEQSMSCQSSINFKFSPGLCFINNSVESQSSITHLGYKHDYQFGLNYFIKKHFYINSMFGIRFINMPGYFKNSDSFNISENPLIVHYMAGSITLNYKFNKLNIELGYGANFMINKNALLVKSININQTAFVYPYNFVPKYQSSIILGISRDWSWFSMGLNFEGFLSHIYDSEGYDIPGPREYRSLKLLNIYFELKL